MLPAPGGGGAWDGPGAEGAEEALGIRPVTTWVRSTALGHVEVDGDAGRRQRPVGAETVLGAEERHHHHSTALLKWIVLATVPGGWAGRCSTACVGPSTGPPPPRRFDVFTVLAIVVVVLWLLPFVVPFVRDMLE